MVANLSQEPENKGSSAWRGGQEPSGLVPVCYEKTGRSSSLVPLLVSNNIYFIAHAFGMGVRSFYQRTRL